MAPAEYGYIALVVVATFLFNMFLAIRVGSARRLYNVPYPTMYALESENKNAKIFNCVQRGHQNFLEILPCFLSLLMIGGLQHPKLSAASGVFFLVFRYFYFRGYSTGDPKKRFHGGGQVMFLVLLTGTTISFAVRNLSPQLVQ